MGRDWQGKRVVIVGLARQGKALARYLHREGAHVIVNDMRTAEELSESILELQGLQLEFELGGHPGSLVDNTDAVFLSGGVPADIPIAQKARQLRLPILNDAQLFLEETIAYTIGVTGSAGKSTVTAWITEMGRAAARDGEGRVWAGGNLGRPLLDDLQEMGPQDTAVMELSSFQLELMTAGVDLAVLLNISPNHLDRHGTLEAYREAKANLLTNQSKDSVAILNRDDPLVWDLRERAVGRLATFSTETEVDAGAFLVNGDITLRDGDRQVVAGLASEIKLPGAHNRRNALAACAAAWMAGWPVEAIREGLIQFRGLPHRLELVAELGEVRWVNDSIATTPERSAAGIRATAGPLVLLLGGRDKGLPWDEALQAAQGRLRSLLLFGEAAGTLERAVVGSEVDANLVEAFPTLAEAVERARDLAKPGDTVLLSPGGTSFDEFEDFEARGEAFRRQVTG